MQTECIPDLFEFEAVEGRPVAAAFDGGSITSDAGAMLLDATDRAIGLIDRFAACFRDFRCPELIEHEVETLIGQRVFGLAAGYEDLIDHDQLRHDPMMAILAGNPRVQARGPARGLRASGGQVDAEPARAEPARADPLPQDQPRRGDDRGAAGRSVCGGPSQLAQADRPRSRRHRRPAARPSRGPLLPRLL